MFLCRGLVFLLPCRFFSSHAGSSERPVGYREHFCHDRLRCRPVRTYRFPSPLLAPLEPGVGNDEQTAGKDGGRQGSSTERKACYDPPPPARADGVEGSALHSHRRPRSEVLAPRRQEAASPPLRHSGGVGFFFCHNSKQVLASVSVFMFQLTGCRGATMHLGRTRQHGLLLFLWVRSFARCLPFTPRRPMPCHLPTL